MKILQITKLLAIIFAPASAIAQGTFQNLDFEQANPVSSGPFPGFVTSASALPGWTVLIGGVMQSQILYNGTTTGASAVDLIGPGAHYGYSPIDGSYSALLQNLGGTAAAAISQSGTIPARTQSLLFEAVPPSAPGPDGPLEIDVGGQTIPYAQVGAGPNYVLYGANISAWAGQTEQLAFLDPQGSGNWELDDITFSSTAVVPEPSPLLLTGLGGVLFALCRKFVFKRA